MSALSGKNKGLALRRAAGEVLIAGIEGTSLSTVEAGWMKLIRPGGIILFRRNVESATQTHALLAAIKETAQGDSPALLRCIDVEGGTVDRLRDLLTPMPSAFDVARTGNSELFVSHGRLIGAELRMLGLNTTFAPVLDLRTAFSESVMTSRAASGEAAEVTRYAGCFLEGLAERSVLGCGKHFPGLGSGKVDSHRATPQIEKPFDLLWEEDLLPYRKLAARLPLVMISHGAYPLTPSGAEPASVSRFWTTDVLVRKIGFRGLIVSDDMEMGGILSHTGLADAALQCLLAGCHLIEICRDPALVFTAYEALLHEAETSPAFAHKLRWAAARVQTFKRKGLKDDRLPEPPSALAVSETRNAILRFASQVAKAGQSGIPEASQSL